MPDFQEFWLVAADPEVRQLTGEHCWVHRPAEEKGRRNVSWKMQRVAFDVRPVLTGCRQEYSLMAVLKKSPLKCLCCLKLARAFQLAVKGCFVHQLGKAGWEKTPNLYPNKRTSPYEWFDFPPGFSAVLARWILRGNSDNCLWALGRCQRRMQGSIGWKEGFAQELVSQPGLEGGWSESEPGRITVTLSWWQRWDKNPGLQPWTILQSPARTGSFFHWSCFSGTCKQKLSSATNTKILNLISLLDPCMWKQRSVPFWTIAKMILIAFNFPQGNLSAIRRPWNIQMQQASQQAVLLRATPQ